MARAAKSAGGAGVRVFPAQPPEPGRRGFGATWWGREWVTALEQTSMDSGRLSRGRSYARAGAVGEITVKPGRLTAKVRGSAPRPYSSGIRLGILTDAEWDRLLDVVAAKALHIAALLDRDMPQGLVDDAAAAGVHLLPHGSELEPSCSCPDWGYPCKHAAALCYQIARIMDEDPFVLLLMRGRDEPAIMAELHRRNTVRAAVERSADDQHEHDQTSNPLLTESSDEQQLPATLEPDAKADCGRDDEVKLGVVEHIAARPLHKIGGQADADIERQEACQGRTPGMSGPDSPDDERGQDPLQPAETGNATGETVGPRRQHVGEKGIAVEDDAQQEPSEDSADPEGNGA